MHDRISTDGPQRPRARRGLGVLIGVTLMATPLAITPAASAQTGSGDALGGLDTLVRGVIDGLTSGQTLGRVVGDGSSRQERCYTPDGLGSTLSCVVLPVANALYPARDAKARIKAKRIGSSVRWVK